MEKDQELKHVCKLRTKSFSCGRSLGGHMRSRVINSSRETDQIPTKKKLSSINNGRFNANPDTGTEAVTNPTYGLRENPKKTCRFAGSNDNTSLHDKLCRECGKGFQSWKALFGHMKCHSEKLSNTMEAEDSWSQSDNETGALNRKKRSRSVRRYLANTSSSLSMANNNCNHASSSVSEIDQQEQEEVAMCLMMLSRDVGSKSSGLNSVDESSDNNFELLEAKTSIRINRVSKTEKFKKLGNGKLESTILDSEDGGYGFSRNGSKKKNNDLPHDGCFGNHKSNVSGSRFEASEVDGENVKFKKLRNGKLDYSTTLDSNSQFGMKGSEYGASGFSRNGSKQKKPDFSQDGCFGKDKSMSKMEDGSRFGTSEVELGKNLVKENGLDQEEFSSKRQNLSKKGLSSCGTSGDSEMDKNKNKFECATCNKTFHSYQALGGHRASHKKIKGCFASKIDNSSENSIETEISPHPNPDFELIKKEDPNDQEKAKKVSNVSKKNSIKGGSHECPICFKVFPSGQALGGHKRSHLIGGSEAKSNQSVVTQKPISEVRDFLDLNLPAPVEEETSGFKPWWVGSNHDHKPILGLISN